MPFDTLDPAATDSPRPPRSFVAGAFFSLGLIAARSLPEINAGTWFSLACAAGALAAGASGRTCKAALATAAFLIGAGWFALRIWGTDADSLRARLPPATAILTVEGMVLDNPGTFASDGPLAPFAARQPTASCSLRVNSIGDTSTDGLLRLRVTGTQWAIDRGLHGFPVKAGDHVRVTGTFEPVPAPTNPGESDARLFAAQQSLAGTIEALDAGLITAIPAPNALRAFESRLRSSLADTRAVVRAALDPGVSSTPEARALTLSLLLGDNETGIAEVRSTFTRLGLAHVLAISGFHLALLAWLATIALRPFSRFDATSPTIVAIAVVLYTLLVPAEAPVLRSAVMVLVLLATESLGRRYDRLATLGWVAIGLLIWRPLDLWSLGFQLSLGLTAALLWLAPRLNARVWPLEIRGLRRPRRSAFIHGALWAGRRTGHALTTTMLCWLVSLPLVAHTTGLVSLATLPATLIVLPLAILVMVAGFACAIIAAVASLLGLEPLSFATPVVSFLSRMAVCAADALDGIPFATAYLPPIGLAATAVVTALAINLLCYAHRRDIRVYLAIVACAAVVAADQGSRLRRDRAIAFQVDAIHVAPGICSLVRSRGEALLINAGARSLARPQPTIPRTARALGSWHIPTAVITSSNPSHFGGILECVEPLGLERVIAAPALFELARLDASGPQATIINELRRKGVDIVEAAHPLTVTVGDQVIRFIPDEGGSLVYKLELN